MRRPLRIGPAKGFQYHEADPALYERFVAGMEACECPADVGAELLFDHEVRRGYRLGDRVIKYYGSGRSRDSLRASPAVRAADAYARLLPVRSPRPEFAVELRRGLHLHRSLIVCEFVDGPLLGEAWGKVPEVADTLGPFLAELHDRGIYHGVMKWDHLIWNHGEWVILDTESLRHGMRRLRPDKLARRQWTALALDLSPSEELRGAFEAYVRVRELPWDLDATWDEIVAKSRALLAANERT